ncbi:hypothetical protein LJK87_20060 [Paenibacillus sp. P25]|nr:hypothetical protein LJK87_20060 [Paenibacillus sp. P25]
MDSASGVCSTCSRSQAPASQMHMKAIIQTAAGSDRPRSGRLSPFIVHTPSKLSRIVVISS